MLQAIVSGRRAYRRACGPHERHRRAVLDGIAGTRPRVDAAGERTYATEALPDEDLRTTARRLLVRACAIDNDVAVRGKIVGARDRIQIEQHGARDMRA